MLIHSDVYTSTPTVRNSCTSPLGLTPSSYTIFNLAKSQLNNVVVKAAYLSSYLTINWDRFAVMVLLEELEAWQIESTKKKKEQNQEN